MQFARTCVLGAALATGCASPAPSSVTNAELGGGLQVSLGCLLGFSLGLASIDADYADGTSESVGVLLAAGFNGMVLDGSFGFLGGELTVPPGGVARTDLFLPYRGDMWGATVGIGVRREKVANAKGVGLHTTVFSIGLDAAVGEETLYVIPLWSSR